MKIKPSTLLRNNYSEISNMVHESAEPVYITRNGEGDAVIMSIESYEEREHILSHRADILSAELDTLRGATTYSSTEMKEHLYTTYFPENEK